VRARAAPTGRRDPRENYRRRRRRRRHHCR